MANNPKKDNINKTNFSKDAINYKINWIKLIKLERIYTIQSKNYSLSSLKKMKNKKLLPTN
jgi:hypothetical protein